MPRRRWQFYWDLEESTLPSAVLACVTGPAGRIPVVVRCVVPDHPLEVRPLEQALVRGASQLPLAQWLSRLHVAVSTKVSLPEICLRQRPRGCVAAHASASYDMPRTLTLTASCSMTPAQAARYSWARLLHSSLTQTIHVTLFARSAKRSCSV